MWYLCFLILRNTSKKVPGIILNFCHWAAAIGQEIAMLGGKNTIAAAAAKSLQSCLALCNPTDGSPPGFPIPGNLQARTLEWVAISFSNAWKWEVKVKSLSHVRLLATPWTAAHQAPPSMGFSRQEYWSGVPLPSPYYSYLSKNTNNHDASASVSLGFFSHWDMGVQISIDKQ